MRAVAASVRPRPPPCRSRSSALPVGADRRITGAVGNERPSGPSIGTPTVNGKFQVHRQLRRRHGVRGIKVVRTPVQAPARTRSPNAGADRTPGVLGPSANRLPRQIESVVQDYICHYNRARPHRGLGLAVPRPSSDIRSVGRSFAVTSSAGSSTSTNALLDPRPVLARQSISPVPSGRMPPSGRRPYQQPSLHATALPENQYRDLRAPKRVLGPQVCLVVMNESHLPSEEKLGDDGTWPLGQVPLPPSRWPVKDPQLALRDDSELALPLKDSTLTNAGERVRCRWCDGLGRWVTGWAKVPGSERSGNAQPEREDADHGL